MAKTQRLVISYTVAVLAVLTASSCVTLPAEDGPSPSPTGLGISNPTPTPRPSSAPTPTPTMRPTGTPAPTNTPAPTATPGPTATPVPGGSGLTYYISPTGDDSRTAAQAQNSATPWKTLYKAASSVTTAGATIKVLAGTYLETQASQLAVGVSLEGVGNTSVLQSTLTADWKEMLTLSSPEGTNGNQHISNLKFDGRNLSTFWAIYVGGRSNVSIHDITVVDFKDRGVIIGGRNDNASAAPTIYAKGITFYNNTISNSGAYNLISSDGVTPLGEYGRGCLNVGGTEGMLIYNNNITQNQRPIGYNGWPIKAWNDGYNRGLKIYNNVITKIPFTGGWGGDRGWDFAVEMFNDQGTEFYNNTVDGAGFDTNWQLKGPYAYSVWIHDNVFSLPAQVSSNNTAVTLEFSTDNAIVERNVINKMSNCILFTPRAGNSITNLTIRNNLCINAGKLGGNGTNGSFINVSAGQSNFSINGFNVFNNTFVADPNNRPWWGIELGGSTMGTITNINIKNNVLMNTVAGAITQGSVGGVVMDYVNISNNDIYNNSYNNDPVWSGTPPTHYSYMDNIHVDPLFVSASDFKLQMSSSAVNKGTNVGLPFLGSAPDIGYAESY